MKTITIRNEAADGTPLAATFCPDKGMNLLSYKRGDIEVIDQSTRPLFDERAAGLGALIGPHFHWRNPKVIPAIENESAFPHIAKMRANGAQDPFSHGIARYVAWEAMATEESVSAKLEGKQEWNGVPLSRLGGQDFRMTFGAMLKPEGLNVRLSVVSDSDSLVGIHYYYSLPNGVGTITSDIAEEYLVDGEYRSIPDSWEIGANRRWTFTLDGDADFTLHPYLNRCAGAIVLDADIYQLTTRYRCASQENCWQLYQPKGSSFVCIEPMSAANPRKPQLTVSSIDIDLVIRALSS